MKTIFFTVYDGDIEKNFLQSDVLKTLQLSDNRIVLLMKFGLAKRYAHFQHGNTIVEELPPSQCFSEKLFYWIGWNAIPTHSIHMRRYETYLKNQNILQYQAGRVIGILGRFRLFRNFLRFVYALIPDDYAVPLFEKYKPDILFAPSMFSYEDGRLLRIAKRRGIKTITNSKSWDVLTNKAFTRVRADKILVQNNSIRVAAIRHGDYEEDQVKVVGFVQFDYVFDSRLLMSRSDFFRKIGADPDKKLILYATSGDWKNPYDDEVVQSIHDAITDNSIETPAQILARFHPKYPSKIEKLNLPFLIKDRPCTDEGSEDSLDGVTDKVYSFTFNREDWAHLANSLYHSDVTINTVSTITLDAVAFDKPVVLIAHDGHDRKLPYWQSLRRTYDETHYRDIVDANCAKMTTSTKQTIDAIRAYLKDSHEDSAARKVLRDQYLFGLDGQAGKRIANEILSHLSS